MKTIYCYVSDCDKEAKVWFIHKKSKVIAQEHYCRKHAKEMIEQGLFKNYEMKYIRPKKKTQEGKG